MIHFADCTVEEKEAVSWNRKREDITRFFVSTRFEAYV